MSVTSKGELSQRTSFLVLISIVALLLSAMAILNPMTALAQDDPDAHPALNILKENEAGEPLAGAVFMVEGSDEQFTTGDDGKVCITRINGQFVEDRPYRVTEVTPPPGYALAADPSKMVEPDTDGSGHCRSPDAKFVDPTASPTPTPTPSEGQSGGTPTPTPTPSDSEAGGTPSPRESELGGNPTPTPELPDTATPGLAVQLPALVLALILVASLALLMYARVATERR